MLRLTCFVFAVVCFSAALHAGDQPIVTTDLLRIRTVTAIDVTGDGSRAVFAVQSIETQEAENGGGPSYAYRSHLFGVDLRRRDAQPRQLTFGRRNDTAPQLSPDGRYVAFQREGEDGGQSQVWVLPLDGGEARQVTDMQHGARSPQWSPDGRSLLYSAPVPIAELDGLPPWPLERPNMTWQDLAHNPNITPRPDGTREEVRAWLDQNAVNHDPFVISRLNFQEEQRLRGTMRFAHLFLIDANADRGVGRRITDGFFNHDDAAFMPEGNRIVYVANKDTEAHPDRNRASELWMIDVDGTNDRRVVSIENWRLRSPKPSVDGSVIAFTGQHQDEPSFRQWQLGVVSIVRGEFTEPVWLIDEQTFDASVRSIEWMPARAAVLFTTARRGGFPLMMMSPGLVAPTEIVHEHHGMPVGVQRFGVGGGAIVYAMKSPQNPAVLRVRDAAGDRLLMDLNAWTAEKKLSMPTEGWITRPDGTRVQYWVMEPTNRADGQKYPVVLQIHGGPSAMWGPGEASMWHEFQLLCSWGYGIVYANPRGSGGYGYAFQRANYQNWGEGPAGDVLAAVDQALLEEWVDQERLVVTGGSYAGYLTAWIIAHDHRFKAAVAQRGVYHLPTFFGEGNAWRLVPNAMGGVPSDPRFRQIIERESPFTYVGRIRTPLLILHGSEDLRTGVSQSEMMYRALKYLQRPVEYIRYPNAGHDLSRSGDPKQRMDRLNRIIDFFERHIDNPRPAPGCASGSATPASDAPVSAAPGSAAAEIGLEVPH